MPRAGLYLLAMLQASYNCATAGRRQLHLGLLTSLALVLFAASHYRADWTMLFYILPYLIAAVFTLVASQIGQRSDDLRLTGLARTSSGQGQGAASSAATLSILLLGGVLYLLTPQVSWPYLESRFGQDVPQAPGGELEQAEAGGRPVPPQPKARVGLPKTVPVAGKVCNGRACTGPVRRKCAPRRSGRICRAGKNRRLRNWPDSAKRYSRRYWSSSIGGGG